MLKTIQKGRKKYRGAKYGSMCMFVRISKTRGVKLYNTRRERDYAYKLQKKAYKAGVGPKVYDCFKLEDYLYSKSEGGYYKYGYKTQIANVRIVPDDDSRMVDLVNTMAMYGFETGDVCWPNTGFIGKRLVCIDFDMGSHGGF